LFHTPQQLNNLSPASRNVSTFTTIALVVTVFMTFKIGEQKGCMKCHETLQPAWSQFVAFVKMALQRRKHIVSFLKRMAFDKLRALSLDREVLERLDWLEGCLPKDRRV
jgi:hypothetical protein